MDGTATTNPTAADATPARQQKLYVQYGCGLCAPDGWLNFDASPTLRLQKLPLVGGAVPGPKFPKNVRYGDIRKGLPLPDGSADAVYCSHVLEHLALEDFREALKNTYRLLKPGGTFRFVLPDLRYHIEQYMRSTEPDAATKLVEGLLLGQVRRPRGLVGLLRSWAGNADHRWMWDFESMKLELERAGFVNVRRAAMGDNPDPMFAKVEEERRWTNQLGMECRKPA